MSSHSPMLFVAERARSDMEEIYSYTLDTWGQRRADQYEAAIDRALQELVTFPLRGRPRDELFSGCRSRLVEHHQIYYFVESDVINVVRILHERQDPANHILL